MNHYQNQAQPSMTVGRGTSPSEPAFPPPPPPLSAMAKLAGCGAASTMSMATTSSSDTSATTTSGSSVTVGYEGLFPSPTAFSTFRPLSNSATPPPPPPPATLFGVNAVQLDMNTVDSSGIVASNGGGGCMASNNNTVCFTMPVGSGAKEVHLCMSCGQFHDPLGPHLYDYNEPIDEDLLCQLCRQPLVEPLDTKCGQTFCTPCLKKHLAVQALCPIDRHIINFLECKQAGSIVRKLLDKLLVVCPNVDYCEEVLPRCELEAHLMHRCRGAVTRCSKAHLGCAFKGPRTALHNHLWECPFRSDEEFSGAESCGAGDGAAANLSSAQDLPEGVVTTIEIARGCSDLGLSFVGGCDTPLMCIVIQEIYIDGIVAKDGRLRPGDQILEVNSEDLTQATHSQAKRALSQLQAITRLTVYREKAEESLPIEKEEILKISLSKRVGKTLGIKLVGKKSCAGLFILGLVQGGLAELDGRLRKDDRILEINGVPLGSGTQEEAAQIIQSAPDRVTFILSRRSRPQTPDIIRTASGENITDCCTMESGAGSSVGSAGSNKGHMAATNNVVTLSRHSRERLVSIPKEPGESLGMSVAGGVGSQRGDIPVYVTNLAPDGLVGRTKQVKKGDILLSVNERQLIGLSHEESVRVLKAVAHDHHFQVHLIEGPETSSGAGNFMPSWVYWLQLPRLCHFEKSIELCRDPSGSLGFSIVGGNDGVNGSQPIIIKSIVPGGAAHHDGRIRCGDLLVRVNQYVLADIAHAHAVSLLKHVRGNLLLTLVSWPGTIV